MPKTRYSILTSFFGIDNYSAREGAWLAGKYYFYDNPSLKDSPETRQKMAEQSKNRARLSWLKYKVKKLTILRYIAGPFLILGQILPIVQQGVKVAKETKAEILLAVSDFGPALIGSYFIHKRTKKPFVLYLFDIYWGNNLVAPGNFLANIFEPKLFRSAKKIIVTNEGTKRFYVERYGPKIAEKIVVIYNAVFPDGYRAIEKNAPLYSPAPPYTVLFTGSIYWPQIGALKNVIKAVNSIEDLDLHFKIYSPSPRNYLKEIGIEASDKVEISVAPPQDMPKIQSDADILLLPLSWNTKSQAIIDTATPGKLTDYLIAGRPMLIHAPSTSTVVKYARGNDFASICDEDNVELLSKKLRELVTDKDFANRIVRNARATFLKNHDANKNALLFAEVFK